MCVAFSLFRLHALFLSILLLLAGLSSAGAQHPLIHLRHEGGLSRYRHYEVVIAATGEARVSLVKYADKNKDSSVSYETKLSEYELRALLEIIDAAGVKESRLADFRPGVGDCGLTSISVHCDDWSNTVSFSRSGVMNPLTRFIGRLIGQAEVIHEIESDGNPYYAMTAVKPTSTGAEVLQPYALKAPLIAYIKTGTDNERLNWAFTALAWLTTPEEYLGLVAAERKKPTKTGIPRYAGFGGGGGIPEAHTQMICVAKMSFVRANHQNFSSLSYEDKKRLESAVSSLGSARYMDALPLLTEVFSDCQKSGLNPDNVLLYYLKRDGLAVIQGFLQNGNEFLRKAAIGQCESAARSIHNNGVAPPLSPADTEAMRTLLKDHVLPSLLWMKSNDPEPGIRQRAEAAVVEIERETGR